MKGYLSAERHPTSGKRVVVFTKEDGLVDRPITIPCGYCRWCRLEKSREWAIRCVHEAQMHEHNSYITLTYSNDYLPAGNTLVKAHFQKFMKRLRKRYNGGIRYFHCGEYGERNNRPHYHAILFGIRFSDLEPWKKNKRGEMLYTSRILEQTWGHGFCSVGEVTFDSAAYVARYIMKKVVGENAGEHYGGRLPEYVTMSKHPGIAADWFEKYADDVYPSDFITVGGVKMRPPKYYDRQLERNNPIAFREIKRRRTLAAKKMDPYESSLARLMVKDQVLAAKQKLLTRDLEED